MSSKLLALAGLSLLARYALAVVHTTTGAGGDTCGPVDRLCLAGKATCNAVTGKCVCNSPKYDYGNGYVNCYKSNTFRTEVFNDPNVLTFNGNSIGLPIPCRYFWTHTRTWLKNRHRERVGYCTFQAYAFHQKSRGKFYVGGYDVAINVTYDDGREVLMSIRKNGTAGGGYYFFTIDATDGMYLPQGDWGNDAIAYYDPVTNLKIECEFDEFNNLAVIHAKKCGIRIQFRPYDERLRLGQREVPHIAYAVNCAYHPVFLNKDLVVALPPAAQHGGMTIDTILIAGLTGEQTLVYRALHSMADQTYAPYPNQECWNARSSLDNCNDIELIEAFYSCFWILKLPRFIRCFDPTVSGELIMGLFNRCVDIFCGTGICNAVIGEIEASGCDQIDPPYAIVTDFVNNVYCT